MKTVLCPKCSIRSEKYAIRSLKILLQMISVSTCFQKCVQK